jgi:DNA polymerase I
MAKFYDTLLWEYIKNPWMRWLSLDDLALRYFDYKMISYDEVSEKWKINFKDIDLEQASIYSWEDVYITAKIYNLQCEEKVCEEKILNEIEIPLMEVLKDMELTWVKVDLDKLQDIWEKLKIEIKTNEEKIYEVAWEKFNINSPKQVWVILFEKLGLPTAKKTKTWYSVDNEVLESLAFKHEIARYIVNYRTAAKLLWTYIEWLSKIISPITWRIHTNYSQTIAATWRLSSINPNLQNIPVWAWLGWEIREAFIPFEKDDVIMAADYSQIEVRLLAILSGDENLSW